MSISEFKHQITEQVRFHEVDMMGICNNAVYFNYFEDARLKYLQDLDEKFNFTEFLKGDSFVIMAHNEIDYLNSSYLDDQLTIYSKIAKVSNSSFSFEHFVYRERDNKEIARGGGVLVHINRGTKISQPLPQEFHDAVISFEGE